MTPTTLPDEARLPTVKDLTVHPVAWTDEQVERFWTFTERHAGPKYFAQLHATAVIRRARRAFTMPVASVLDFGCGPGHLVGDLLTRGYMVAAHDQSPTARDRVRLVNHPQPRFLGAWDAEELDYLQPQFDAVFCLETLEHITDLPRTLDRLSRLVRPDGYLVVTTPNRERLERQHLCCPACAGVFHRWQHVRAFTPQSLVMVLEKAGFEARVCRETVFPDTWTDLARAYWHRLHGEPWPNLFYVGRKC